MVLVNGTVLTADDKDSEAEAVAVWNGRIGAVGGTSDIDALRDRRTRVIDLKGRTVLPGLTDPHVHFADGGASMMNLIDCRDFLFQRALHPADRREHPHSGRAPAQGQLGHRPWQPDAGFPHAGQTLPQPP
jgi:predicted amidohydrolase YtcJ